MGCRYSNRAACRCECVRNLEQTCATDENLMTLDRRVRVGYSENRIVKIDRVHTNRYTARSCRSLHRITTRNPIESAGNRRIYPLNVETTEHPVVQTDLGLER